jgi:hypothetical protein
MTLVEDGLYIPLCIRKFKLVEGVKDILNIVDIVECLTYVKVTYKN